MLEYIFDFKVCMKNTFSVLFYLYFYITLLEWNFVLQTSEALLKLQKGKLMTCKAIMYHSNKI